jgi:hypothetical protein
MLITLQRTVSEPWSQQGGTLLSEGQNSVQLPWSFMQSQSFAQKISKGIQAPVGSKAEIWGSKYLKPSMVSSNVLAEPYKGPKASLPLTSYFTPSGWGLRWNRWKDSWKSMYSMSKLKKNIKHWDLRQFKMDALESYIETNKALAKGDLSALRSLATPAIFSDMKKQIKQREKSGWESIEWDMVKKPDLYDVELVQVRVLAADQKDDETAFVQLTVRIPSTQSFTAFNKQGRIVSTGSDKTFDVVDHWVFEIPLSKKAQQKYRVAARLNIVEP